MNDSRKLHEDSRSNGRVPLETNQANLGTVSEMSQSVNEFDFSSIEEFPADEDQQAINCREMKPLFSKIEKCK